MQKDIRLENLESKLAINQKRFGDGVLGYKYSRIYELKRLGWEDSKIAFALGVDVDMVSRAPFKFFRIFHN